MTAHARRVESDDLGLMIAHLQAGGTITPEAALSIALDLADERKTLRPLADNEVVVKHHGGDQWMFECANDPNGETPWLLLYVRNAIRKANETAS